jgi:hypothetical protein
MPLTPETGSGADPAANCYIDVADCDAFHSERGNAAWTGNAAAKEAAIIKASEYLDYMYVWKGERITDTQPMQWPRLLRPADARDFTLNSNYVPPEVVKANAMLALLALTGELAPEQSGQRLQSESVSVGGAVTRSRSFAGGGGFSNERRFPMVDAILSRFATGGSSGVRSQRIERA